MFVKLILSFVSFYCASAALPSYIQVCKKNVPDMTACIINSVDTLRPKLAEGIPELGVPSIEPLPLPEIKLRSGPKSAKIDANITNIKVWGPSSFEVLELRPEVAKNRFVFRINIPHLYFKGDYDIDINVVILKYKGQGPITGNFTNMQADVLLKGHLKEIDGKAHLHFEKFKIQLSIQKSYLHLGELFAQQAHLGTATNEVINGNSDLFVNEIKPALESSLADIFTEAANSICKSFTYDELFPEN
ncbi:circadian clock-controlled protein daywake-like [Leptinotarsa decemlineata]|uniref:circadian clock-controlled protein daywake-like n=1 Tax=Leptinotarsa decemlineata TaxID=7539 RepID=UPI000C2517E0|nr:uncharacterized protein LOC111511581 isoform X1 [Leptinotarsa decemlineata]XP_023023385.1 uncharacterized protein LOC111511581 isoform X2 [Leptinotarsa decemlineata]